ncbi:MAG: DUF6565 domain-containing protein [Bacteroidales bacterium]
MRDLYYFLFKNILFFSFILITSIILLSFTSCIGSYSKANYLKDFNAFVTEVEANQDLYTSHEWDIADKEYENFTTTLYQEVHASLTPEDQRQIGTLKASFKSLRLKNMLKNGIQSFKDGLDQAAGAVEGLVD